MQSGIIINVMILLTLMATRYDSELFSVIFFVQWRQSKFHFVFIRFHLMVAIVG